MPELPEVEVVRRGLAEHIRGLTIEDVDLRGARVARRHLPGPLDLAARLRGAHVAEVCRRGKYLWLALDRAVPGVGAEDGVPNADPAALVLHLGMSGQLLVEDAEAPDEKHLHARITFAGKTRELRFVDQRTFGGLAWSETGADGIPVSVAHIAPDPFDPAYDRRAVIAAVRARSSAIKRVLLDQRVLSGIGNIYADEALWRAGVHGERVASTLTGPAIGRVLDAAVEVMAEALGEGGTSFDALYVNVNGASGYFDRSLAVYGQQGRPCPRCGALVRREAFMNRSSHFCPRCQPAPRRRH